MTEINKNIQPIGINEIKYSAKKPEVKVDEPKIECGQCQKEIKDTGVLGRDLVVNPKNDISKSVDEAVEIAAKRPDLLRASDGFFNTVYRNLLDRGLSDSDAYMGAALAEAEFLDSNILNK